MLRGARAFAWNLGAAVALIACGGGSGGSEEAASGGATGEDGGEAAAGADAGGAPTVAGAGTPAGGEPATGGGAGTPAGGEPATGGGAGTPAGGAGASAATGGGGGAPSGGTAGGVGGAAGTAGAPPEPGLVGAPLVFAPTTSGFGINAVITGMDPAALTLRVREADTLEWSEPSVAEVRASDVAEWHVDGLGPGLRYEFELSSSDEPDGTLYAGEATTQREPDADFTFALFTDSHIGAYLSYSNQGDAQVLAGIADQIQAAAPDFAIHLGDMLDFHYFGFNVPPPDASIARLAYLNYRQALGGLPGHAAHYATIGNWEGENGDFAADAIAWSRDTRMLYLPNPGPDTYAEGGSDAEDYYAFTWGDALFVVLNVMTYTTTSHLLSSYPGAPDDWTLGAEQLTWLQTTLENATSRWRFLCIHHTVGGAAGDEANSGYGRGGGQAAYVGEQATVHQLMLDHGVQAFFYGHDHGFVDQVVDGIHYSMPGNAGAPWTFTEYETGYTDYLPLAGWARVDVTTDSVHVQYIDVDGLVLYEYTLD